MDSVLKFWRRFKTPLLVWILSRIVLTSVMCIGLQMVPMNPDAPYNRALPANPVLDGWLRWDSGWFLHVVRNGYRLPPDPGMQSNLAFFPLYPLLIKGLSFIISNDAIAALIISQGAALVGAVLLYDLVSRQHNDRTACWTVILYAVHPFTVYLGSVYSEGLFWLCVVGAFNLGQKRRWFWAGLVAGLASATRSVGLLVGLGLLLQYLESIDFQWGNIKLDILWLGLTATGLGGYMLYLWLRFDDPWLWMKVRQVAGWAATNSYARMIDILTRALNPANWMTFGAELLVLLNLALGVGALMLLFLTRKKLQLAQSLWAALTILISFSAAWQGMGRYTLPLFPVVVTLPLLVKRDELLAGAAYAGAILSALLAFLFSHMYWVA